MTQEDLIFHDVREQFAARREICDGTARAIAASFHDGSTVALAFVSTGTIPAVTSDCWHACGGDEYAAESADWRLALDMLGTYLLANAGRSAVSGWSELWIGQQATLAAVRASEAVSS
jgi:hypothetical protein